VSRAQHIGEAPFSERRGLLAGLAAALVVLGVLVVFDALPRLNPPPPKAQGAPFLPGGVEGVEAIEITRGRKNFRLEREGTGWAILDRGTRSVIADDRVDEFLSSLDDLVVLVDIGPASDVSLEEFGLSRARDGISLIRSDGERTEIRIGDRNPPLTGVYALVLPGEKVVLVGAVLLLDVDTLATLASSPAPQKEDGKGAASLGQRPRGRGIVQSHMEESTHAQ